MGSQTAMLCNFLAFRLDLDRHRQVLHRPADTRVLSSQSRVGGLHLRHERTESPVHIGTRHRCGGAVRPGSGRSVGLIAVAVVLGQLIENALNSPLKISPVNSTS